MMQFFHPFHLVTMSPWPLLMSLSLMNLFMGFIEYMMELKLNLLIFAMILSILILIQWWRDVIRESTLQGFHLIKVINGMQFGMLLFIIFEVMFFISFFWTFFHMFLCPSIEIGMKFPSNNIIKFNPFNIPFLNTIILLSSGIFITWSHFSILNKNKKMTMISIIFTIFLGMVFSMFQVFEYFESYFTINDSSYGSIFFLMTGFHGIHVIIGTIFIFISSYRIYLNHYSMNHHFGFESASWYWHFVDVVWLFLYLFIYWLPM
uniref:Cytochrome c oxidase subunit 3 n=1 Tax=Pselaphanus sp. QL-2013 TaxID=1421598 RepID=A0A0A6ZKV8_9HYME|nr:cytochrome c oxidase subunit III [Pselaphanus sp. QL-2013]